MTYLKKESARSEKGSDKFKKKVVKIEWPIIKSQ